LNTNDSRLWLGGYECVNARTQKLEISARSDLNPRMHGDSQAEKKVTQNDTRRIADRIPESFSAFCNIVSLTAAKTSLKLVI
jgi:hypothetical protein